MTQMVDTDQTALFETLRMGLEASGGFDDVAVRQAAQEFVGRSVVIEPLDKSNHPVSAFVYATPYPAFGVPHYRLQNGLFLRTHPSHVRGSVEGIELADATLRVKPGRWSAYRFDRGYFQVSMLDEQHEPLVRVFFLEDKID